MTINLAQKHIDLLKEIAGTDMTKQYANLKADLSAEDKADLRRYCDEDGYITDNDLFWAIINAIKPKGRFA